MLTCRRAVLRQTRLKFLDVEVLEWFQRQGPGYQTRINRALRKVMMEKRK